MHLHDILDQAQNLIREPRNWCKGAFARNHPQGTPTLVYSDRATCFCSVGAVRRVLGPDTPARPVIDLLKKAAGQDVVAFNDTKPHREVMAMFDRAKELAREHA